MNKQCDKTLFSDNKHMFKKIGIKIIDYNDGQTLITFGQCIFCRYKIQTIDVFGCGGVVSAWDVSDGGRLPVERVSYEIPNN